MDRHQLAFLAVLLLVSRPAAAANEAPSCGQVDTEVLPCLSYLKNGLPDVANAEPSAACCAGVKDLVALAKAQPDRVAICNCIKSALGTIGSYDPTKIPSLPQKCGVSLSLPAIDKNFDCSTVSFQDLSHI